MNVTFQQTDENIASTRLRNIIPFRELMKLGWKQGPDILVCSKHNWRWNAAVRYQYRKVVFDICDDWFDDPLKGPHYLEASEKADVITCNSEAMRLRILEKTGRDAVVIDDPYEHPESPPGMGEGVLWFGHRINLQDLYDAKIKWPLTIVTNVEAPWCVPWSPEALMRELGRCRVVALPTGPRQCKSANRAVTAIRAGRFPVCGELPAYRELPGIWVGDVAEGLEMAMTQDVTDKISEAQAYVAERFSPKTVGEKWNKVLSALI